jgi:hypothetical protein
MVVRQRLGVHRQDTLDTATALGLKHMSLANFFHERFQSTFDVFDTALAPPMALGWEIDDVFRIGKLTSFENQHLSRTDVSALADCFVELRNASITGPAKSGGLQDLFANWLAKIWDQKPTSVALT